MYGPFKRAGKPVTVTIANGATDSGIIDTRGYSWGVIQLPAAFTGTTIGFKGANSLNTANHEATTASVIAATFVSIYDETGTIYSLTAGTSRIISIPAYVLVSPFIKIVSGSAEGAERTLYVTLLS
jgi:hypothetical protein